jgi:hypothetical protein
LAKPKAEGVGDRFQAGSAVRSSEVASSSHAGQIIGRMIAPVAQMMLPSRLDVQKTTFSDDR